MVDERYREVLLGRVQFIEVTGISDMSDLGPTELRYYSLRLKYHLVEMKNAGTPVMDGDVEMTVPIVG